MFLNIFCQTQLVLVLNIHKLMLALFIIHIQLQLADGGKILDPPIPDFISHPLCQKRIAMKQETPLGNAVGLVVELLRHHLIEIL